MRGFKTEKSCKTKANTVTVNQDDPIYEESEQAEEGPPTVKIEEGRPDEKIEEEPILRQDPAKESTNKIGKIDKESEEWQTILQRAE